jgi:DSF synthase
MNTLSAMNQVVRTSSESQQSDQYRSLSIHHDQNNAVAWCYMRPSPRPCFTPGLLDELDRWSRQMRLRSREQNIRFHVTASAIPGVFNLGGDLEVFRALIEARDADRLYTYAKRCIDVLFANITSFDSDLTTIALVQGEALGGGFEGALSSEVLIAERQARFGFPEILFNLFPGMGAFSLLSRRLDAKRAEQLILSGKVYTAEELHAMGLVDVLVDEGEGEAAVYGYIKRENRSRNGYMAFRKARDSVNPITYEELDRITQIWVKAALELERRDLKMMERLVSRQYHSSEGSEQVA